MSKKRKPAQRQPRVFNVSLQEKLIISSEFKTAPVTNDELFNKLTRVQRGQNEQRQRDEEIKQLLQQALDRQGAESGLQPVPVPLDRYQLKILQVLASSKRLMNQFDLEGPVGLSRKMIGQRMRVLLQHGLVSQPAGQRKGYAITEAGRQYALTV